MNTRYASLAAGFRGLPLILGVAAALTAGIPGAPAAARAAAPAASGPSAAATASAAGSWKLLPRAPLTRVPADMTAVWTGREMIIHGNHYPGTGGIRGVTVAYRPATRTWVRLANGPTRPSALETTDTAVWTGSRMLVFGQTSASYNPSANSWRPMSRVPMSLFGAVTGWTGHRFLAWGGTCCEDQSHDGAVYSPASNAWRLLPTAPLIVRRNASGTWTGRELVVAGGEHLVRTGHSPVLLKDAAAYSLATGRWRKIAPMPRREAGATAVWDGKEILFIGGRRAGARGPAPRGLAYNPVTNRWRLLPAMAFPRSGFAAVWTGRQLLVWGGVTASGNPPPRGEAYTPAAGTWTALPASPLRGRESPVAVWTGRQMILWGGFRNGTPPSEFTDGAGYTPAR
jgi:hypothetical protein